MRRQKLNTLPWLLIIVFVIIIMIGGGIVLNIAVAWACAIMPGETTRSSTAYADDVHAGNDLFVMRFEYPRSLHIEAVTGELGGGAYAIVWAPTADGTLDGRLTPESLVPSWARAELLHWGGTVGRPGEVGIASRVLTATGWPMHSMWATFDWIIPPTLASWGWEARHGIVLPDDWQPYEALIGAQAPRALGTQPIWLGFAVNSIFYACVLGAMMITPLIVRRRWRLKRGRCPACGYPIGTSHVCTECGRPVPVAASVPR